MIRGVGTDIVAVARMDRGWRRFGARLAERILAPSELLEFPTDPHPARFLARRFAAKEAFAKALGLGFRDGLALSQIAVVHDARHKPSLALSGCAEHQARRQGVTASWVSISDEAEYALAFVVLETTSCSEA